MSARRALVAVAVAVAAAFAFTIQASCVRVLGIDNEGLVNAVGEMCQCAALQKVDACAETLGGRLDGASDDARAAWLQTYHAHCEDTCAEVLTCLAAVPVCSVGECSFDEECCQVPGQGKKKTCNQDAGQCE